MFRESSINLDITNSTLDGGTFVTVLSILGCVTLCRNDKNCVSFFYNDNKRSCSPSSLLYNTTGLVLEAGSDYYIMKNHGFGMKCESAADCAYKNSDCSQGACQCAVGYSFQPSNNKCVTRCKTYGDDFSINHDKGIEEYNERRYVKLPGVEYCLKSCRGVTNFTCVNVEYNAKKKVCTLGKIPWYEAPKSARNINDTGWDTYIRNCET